jgi:hypothetical protein
MRVNVDGSFPYIRDQINEGFMCKMRDEREKRKRECRLARMEKRPHDLLTANNQQHHINMIMK